MAQVLAQADASSSRAAGVAGQALAPAPVPAAGADVDAEPAAPIAVETGDVGAAVRIDDEFSGNVAGRLMAEEGSGGVRSRDAGVSASTAMAVALAVSPTAAVAGGSGKGTRRKVRFTEEVGEELFKDVLVYYVTIRYSHNLVSSSFCRSCIHYSILITVCINSASTKLLTVQSCFVATVRWHGLVSAGYLKCFRTYIFVVGTDYKHEQGNRRFLILSCMYAYK